MLRIDQLAPRCGILFRQQNLFGYFRELGIAIIAVAIGECELHRFNHDVQIFRRVVAQRFEVVSFQDVHRLDHHRALRPETGFVDLITTIGTRLRLIRLGLKLGKIGESDQAAVGFGERGDAFRHRPFVKKVMHRAQLFRTIAPGFLLRHREFAQSFAQGWFTEDLAAFGRCAIGDKKVL